MMGIDGAGSAEPVILSLVRSVRVLFCTLRRSRGGLGGALTSHSLVAKIDACYSPPVPDSHDLHAVVRHLRRTPLRSRVDHAHGGYLLTRNAGHAAGIRSQDGGTVVRVITSTRPQRTRHADYDYAASGGLIVTHRDKSGKDKELSDSCNAPFSH
jgi:hypothetical protein